MCIVNRMTTKKRKAYLAKKPKIITIWKVLLNSGRTEYNSGANVAVLTQRKIHIARNEPGTKMPIPYKPGFHSYMLERTAKRKGRGLVLKCFVRKSWITQVGYAEGTKQMVYVSKKITPDRSLLEGKVT